MGLRLSHLILVALVGCFGSCILADPPPRSRPAGYSCNESIDCVGDLVCENNLCIDPRTCLDLLNSKKGFKSGKYKIIHDKKAIETYCEMSPELDGGGWTMVYKIYSRDEWADVDKLWQFGDSLSMGDPDIGTSSDYRNLIINSIGGLFTEAMYYIPENGGGAWATFKIETGQKDSFDWFNIKNFKKSSYGDVSIPGLADAGTSAELYFHSNCPGPYPCNRLWGFYELKDTCKTDKALVVVINNDKDSLIDKLKQDGCSMAGEYGDGRITLSGVKILYAKKGMSRTLKDAQLAKVFAIFYR